MSQKGKEHNITFRSVICDFIAADRKRAGAATNLFKLARKLQADAPDTALEAFNAKCQIEEEWVLSAEAGPMQVVELPRSWIQAKSDIRASFNARLDLTSIQSYHSMKAKKVEVRAAKAATTTKMEREPIILESVESALESGKVVDAKSNMIVPHDMLEFVHICAKLSELTRSRVIKAATKSARDAYSLQKQSAQVGAHKRAVA